MSSASPKTYILVWQWIKCHIFESLSTTTHIASNPSHSGNPTRISIDISSLGLSGTCNSRRIPNVEYFIVPDHFQTWHFLTSSCTSFCILFQYYCLFRLSKGCTISGCTACMAPWYSCITCNCIWSDLGTYIFPQYWIPPPCTVHSATVLSFRLPPVHIAWSIHHACRSVWFVNGIRYRGMALCGGFSCQQTQLRW